MRAAPLCVAFLAACVEPPRPAAEARVPTVPGAALELMYLVRGPDRVVRFGGLFGAILDSSPTWRFRTDGGEDSVIVPRETGAFEIVLEDAMIQSGSFHRDEDFVATFRCREAEEARMDAVSAAIGGAGSVPNDLVFLGEGAGAELILVRSGDHAVSVFDPIVGLEAGHGLRLPEVELGSGPVGAQPWFAAALDDGERIVVTAFLHRASYLVHVPSLRIEATFRAEKAIALETPYALPYAYDLEGDGSGEHELTRFVPRSPQGLAVVGSELFVAYSGFVAPRLGPSRPPIYLPGVLARFSLDHPERPPALLVLPLRNPQSVSFDDSSGLLLVTASGVLDLNPEILAASSGGVMIVDPDRLSVVQLHDLGDLAPGSTVVSSNALWVSSLVRPEVVRVPRDGGAHTILRLNEEVVDSVFRLVHLPGGLIGAPSFNTDRLHLIDPERGRLDPAPFFGPLQLGPGRPIFDGLQVVARRPGRSGVDFVGPDLFALSGVASRVVPVQLREVLGP